MALDQNLPFEVAIEKARYEIANAINTIGRNYGVPSSILNTIVEQIAKESKLNALELIVANYDISVPKSNDVPEEQPTVDE
jgi:hypothetical protein